MGKEGESMENNEVELAKLKIEMENVANEISDVKEQLNQLLQKQDNIININNEEVHRLYDKISDLTTQFELLKHRITILENNLSNLHASNRELIVARDVINTKLEELSSKAKDNHDTIEKIRLAKEQSNQSSNTSRTNFLYAICSGVIVAIIMLLINMAI